MSKTIAVIRGDGIGPEIMHATLRVLDELKAGLQYDFVEAGLAAQEKFGELLPRGDAGKHRASSRRVEESVDDARRRWIFFVECRTASALRSLRECASRVDDSRNESAYDGIDIITVRENTEGAYGAEGQTLSADGETAQSLIKVTRRGSERIVRYAFDLAQRTGRKKVTVVHKANIMKTTSGLFLNVAREVAKNYPNIVCTEMIVDNCCMQLVMNPQQFDVIVTTNLFGDIISDLCAGLVGGLGLAPGANIGTEAAIFEAVHGSAPDIAGKGIANPCALLLAACQMLDHLGMSNEAQRVRAAIRDTLAAKDRVTPDLGGNGSTETFADALIERLKKT